MASAIYVFIYLIPGPFIENLIVGFLLIIEKRICNQFTSVLLIVDCLSCVCMYISCVCIHDCFGHSVNKVVMLLLLSVLLPK